MNAQKLILENYQAPGDTLMLTAVVRDLHQCHPGKYLTDVRTPSPDLWRHNPYLTPLNEEDATTERLPCHYPLIHRSNQEPVHFLHGLTAYLSEQLGVRITPQEFKGDIHLSAEEKAEESLVHRLTGDTSPYWIVVAGGKYDFTAKWWATERYQAVVDYFRGEERDTGILPVRSDWLPASGAGEHPAPRRPGRPTAGGLEVPGYAPAGSAVSRGAGSRPRVRFVQDGLLEHPHPPLAGVVDLRGKTSLRELVKLMYHGAGVVCPVTMHMHLCAAVETPPGRPPLRPCVVVAGGREPPHWEAYPGHRFLHTIGQLRCCQSGGCWRSRVKPLGDGDRKDQPGSLCVDVAGDLPRCMDMITAADVIREVERFAGYWEWEAARRMTKSEFQNPKTQP